MADKEGNAAENNPSNCIEEGPIKETESAPAEIVATQEPELAEDANQPENDDAKLSDKSLEENQVLEKEENKQKNSDDVSVEENVNPAIESTEDSQAESNAAPEQKATSAPGDLTPEEQKQDTPSEEKIEKEKNPNNQNLSIEKTQEVPEEEHVAPVQEREKMPEEQQATPIQEPEKTILLLPSKVEPEIPTKARHPPPDGKDPPAYSESSKRKIEANFWLEGSYRKVVRRIEDGSKLLDDLSKMVHERAEIESLYANKLKAWKRKWAESYSKSFEYNTAYDSILKGLREGDSIADLHLSVYTRLEELSRQVQQWRTETYPKSMTTKIREAKRSEDAFAKAQKPWVIKYNEVNKCMKAYHAANNLLGINNKLLQESKEISTTEQITKLQAKVKKSEQDIILTKEKYEDALRDIGNYNSKYQEDMKYEFDKCQNFEEKRRNFVKEKLVLFHTFVNRSMFAKNYDKIYSDLGSVYESISTKEDLQWFSESYGPSHPFIKLSYIEYDAEKYQQENAPPITSRVGETSSSPSTKKHKSGVCTTL